MLVAGPIGGDELVLVQAAQGRVHGDGPARPRHVHGHHQGLAVRKEPRGQRLARRIPGDEALVPPQPPGAAREGRALTVGVDANQLAVQHREAQLHERLALGWGLVQGPALVHPVGCAGPPLGEGAVGQLGGGSAVVAHPLACGGTGAQDRLDRPQGGQAVGGGAEAELVVSLPDQQAVDAQLGVQLAGDVRGEQAGALEFELATVHGESTQEAGAGGLEPRVGERGTGLCGLLGGHGCAAQGEGQRDEQGDSARHGNSSDRPVGVGDLPRGLRGVSGRRARSPPHVSLKRPTLQTGRILRDSTTDRPSHDTN